jgi:type IV pilus assembly protein PilC
VPQYQYHGRNQSGTVVKGFAEAETVEQLKVDLRKNGIWVTGAQVKSELWQKLTSDDHGKIPNAELILFTKQMGIMLSSNITLLRALETCMDNASKQFRPILIKIIEEIKAGKTYAQVLALYPRIFSPFYIGMIRIGETGSLLGEMHQKIVAYLEQGASLRGKILFASIYPCMVLGVTFIGISIILVFAFPRIADVYKKSNVELPLITQALLNVSDFMIHYWIFLFVLIASILMLFLIFHLHQKPPLKGLLDQITFKVPFYGKLFKRILLYRFTFNLALLMNSGVPLTKAFEVITTIMTNQVMIGYIEELSIAIKKGGGMAEYLKQNKFFPPILVAMVRAGEESGEMVKMINDASKYHEAEVESALNKFITVIEPVLIIFAAGIVIIVLLAFYLPMFQMFKAIR